MSSTAVAGLTIFIVLVVILVSGMPIAVALAASSMIAIVQLLDSAAAITTASQKLFQGISIFTLLAIPAFLSTIALLIKYRVSKSVPATTDEARSLQKA